ncbi:MAG TPA: PBP1A family penicillin-binding protein [Vicinamibacterales bacterium]|nr:PBP1A family penicillin-binding protein [Vicinamibacterales bacterium]
MPVSTLVYDMRDQPAFNIFTEHRMLVDLSEISPYMLHAVLAIEDERFFKHNGIDPWRIGGAALANIKQGHIAQGGSTITQQLARKTFLSDGKTAWEKWFRKAREVVLALRLEMAFSKGQILTMYLNRIYFGRGYYGIEAAAQGYFDKKAAALTLDEAALLAGLIQAPSAYAPPANMDRALARRAVVLKRMQAIGAITDDQAKRALASKVHLRRALGQPRFGEYFRNHVAQELIDRFGEDMVWNSGLRVYTTVDPVMQRAAEGALTAGLKQIERRAGFSGPKLESDDAVANGRTTYLQGAFVALDPRNGHVRALVGGRDFDDSTFDRAIEAKRQAGSAYKPFVFAAAIEKGAGPATMITGINESTRVAGVDWRPDNLHSEADSMTMREALRTSNNRAAVRVLKTVGISNAVGAAVKLGLSAPPAVPSLVLGSGEVSLLSMTTAYGAFADGGVIHAPVFVRRVESAKGEVLWEDVPSSHQAISATTAFLMADMLADVIDRGTGARARQEGFTLPAGGKTGTTNEYKDAWFVGFTPTLVAGVWAGFDDPRPVAPNGYAATLVVPIWAKFMRAATTGTPGAWFKAPADVVNVEICLRSGLRPTAGCVEEGAPIRYEYFRRGTEPQGYCELHPGASSNRSILDKIESFACKLFGKGC